MNSRSRLRWTISAERGALAERIGLPSRPAARRHAPAPRQGHDRCCGIPRRRPHRGRIAEQQPSGVSRAKATKRGGHVLFEDSIRRELETRLTLEAELVLAAERNEFELFYQPQVIWRQQPDRRRGLDPLATSGARPGVVGPNSCRWSTPRRSRKDRRLGAGNRLPPGAAWERAGHNIRIGVNLSPSQFAVGRSAEAVAQALAATGLSPTLLELEVTEDILLHDEQGALDIFLTHPGARRPHRVRRFRHRLCKPQLSEEISARRAQDRPDVRARAAANPDDAAIVSSTIGLSKQLGLSVIAEGIENRATADILVEHGLRGGTGLFLRPADAGQRFRSEIPQCRGRRRSRIRTAGVPAPKSRGRRLARPCPVLSFQQGTGTQTWFAR